MTCAVEVPVQYSGGLEGRGQGFMEEVASTAESRGQRMETEEGVIGRGSLNPSIHPTLGQLGPVISSSV